MSREEIRKTLEAILFDQDFIKPGQHVSETDHYKNDYGCDSLDQVELLMEVEREFCIGTIPDAEAEKMHTVKDTIDYLEKVIQNP